jgi:PAS domain S-box-containing protein
LPTRKLERLQSLVTQTSNLVLFANSGGNVTWANEGFTRILGYTKDEAIGKCLVDLLGSDFPAKLLQEPGAASEENEESNTQFEFRTRHKLGHDLWLQMDLQPYHDDCESKVAGWFAIASDTTEHKRTAGALQQSEMFLASALDANSAHIAILDQDAKIVSVNSMWRQFALENGYDGPNFGVGTNYLEATESSGDSCSVDARRAAEGVRNVLNRSSKHFRMDYQCDSPKEQRWFVMKVARFEVADATYAIVAHENITDRKKNELRLASQQAKFRSVFEGSSDAIMLLDQDGFFDCNSRTLAMFGIESKEQFNSYHPRDLSPEFQPDGQSSAVLSHQRIERALEVGHACFEWIHRRSDGTEFPAEVFLTAFRYQGKRALQASVRDITARKQVDEELKNLNARLQADLEGRIAAEESLRRTTSYLDVYRKIVDHHAIVSETDAAGTIIQVNDAFCRISGYSREELLGNNHRILNAGIHPTEMWAEMYRTAIDEGVWHGEVCIRSKDGELHWLDTTIATLYDDVGQVRGFFAIRADVSGFKKANAAAEAANLAKSEFLANMSHEIRTPMTAILGYADLIADAVERQVDLQKHRDYVETIKRNGEHLLAIINDILDLSKIEANKLVVEKSCISVTQLLHDTIRLMNVNAAAKGLVLKGAVGSDVPDFVITDPTRLRQILVNLVGNAIKFTEHGGVSVDVSYQNEPESILSLCVTDTGIGMSEEQLRRMFQAFEQADASTTRKYGGTGLGLRISKRLAEMLGGDIAIDSRRGEGSTFTVTLFAPAACPHESRHIARPNDQLGPHGTTPGNSANRLPLEGVRILLAEDGPDNQRLISFHLSKAGAMVTIAENGKLALEALCIDGDSTQPLLEPLPFDLIISDMQMPIMDGYESVQLMRTKGCTLPILSLTAHAMQRDQEKCLAAGCNAHLTKPIDRSELIQTCQSWVSALDLPLSGSSVTPLPTTPCKSTC